MTVVKSVRRKSIKTSKSRRTFKPCKSYQYRDPVTNRCRNKSSVKKSGKRKSRKSYKPCKSYQYRDPITNRCRNKSSAKKSVKRKSPKKSVKRKSPKSYKPCKPHQYRDPITKRCRNKEKVKKRKSREPVPRSVKSGRYEYIKKIAKSCVERSRLPLRDLQIKVVQYMDENDGLLVVHGTGCGKTLTAITTTQCYLDKYPNRGVVFVGPASLISNFKKELKAYGAEISDKYEFYSYDKFMLEDKAGRAISLKNKFLVVDEAHNLRNSKSLKSQAVVKASLQADKRLLLSATPFVNSMTDFIPLINMVHGKIKVGTQKEFYEDKVDEYIGKKVTDHNLTTFRYLLEDNVDMVDCKDPNDFPEKIEHYVDVPMAPEYYRRYERLVKGESLFSILFKNPEKFFNGYRRAVNKAGDNYYSDKVKMALPHLKKGKALIYTNWIEFGTKPITQALKKNNITFRTFSGSIPKEDRQGIIDDFNNKIFDVLIITKAGGEGIDLKGVRSVTVLDPTWNRAGLEQIIGRAIRYKSHAHLPESQRKVDVYLMSLVAPKSVKNAIPSGDKLLYEIIEQKNEISTAILGLLRELSI